MGNHFVTLVYSLLLSSLPVFIIHPTVGVHLGSTIHRTSVLFTKTDIFLTAVTLYMYRLNKINLMYVRTVVNGIAARNKTKRHDLARRKSYASEVNFKLITVGLSKRSIVMLMIALIPYVIHVSDSLLHMYSLSESFKTTQYMCRKSTLIARRVTLNHRVYDKNTRFTANLLTIAKRTVILGLTIITFLPLFLEMRTPCQIYPIHDASSN